jgi:hypothetical protein
MNVAIKVDDFIHDMLLRLLPGTYQHAQIPKYKTLLQKLLVQFVIKKLFKLLLDILYIISEKITHFLLNLYALLHSFI